MTRLFDKYIKPILDQASPTALLEIGAASGGHTELLLGWCSSHDARLTTVDPVAWDGYLPEDVRKGADDYRFKRTGGYGKDYGQEQGAIRAEPLERAYQAGHFQWWDCQKDRSVPYLDRCDRLFDVVLLDGEHSYYAVSQELPRIAKVLNRGGLILLHDVIGKHARTDYFYDIQAVPAEFRDMKPGGVMTAVEEFLASVGGVKIGALCAIERYHFDLGRELAKVPSLRSIAGRVRRLPTLMKSGWDGARADLILEDLAGDYVEQQPKSGQWVFEIATGQNGGLGILRVHP